MTAREKNLLSCIEINPSGTAKKSIIWLHGLGADGSDFVPIVPELKLPETMGMRFIFPHAPIMPVTINNGYEMRAWYDITAPSIEGFADKKGIAASVSAIHQLIDKEVAYGIATENIILAGFSQGAVIALTTGLTYPKPLAGILALSGYLPFADEVFKNAGPANRSMPIFIAHGQEDQIVPYALGKAAYVALKEQGYSISWHSYPMGHAVCADEVKDITQWILQTTTKK